MTVEVHRTWYGDELKARAHRANGRALLGMGEAVSTEMKGVAHVVSGDLKRSIHQAAPVGVVHDAELESTGEHPLAANAENIKVGETLVQVEVGSWEPYACVENDRGGDHRFADIGYQLAAPTFDLKLERAYAEEGLRR